jgi:hypothetical protein
MDTSQIFRSEEGDGPSSSLAPGYAFMLLGGTDWAGAPVIEPASITNISIHYCCCSNMFVLAT